MSHRQPLAVKISHHLFDDIHDANAAEMYTTSPRFGPRRILGCQQQEVRTNYMRCMTLHDMDIAPYDINGMLFTIMLPGPSLAITLNTCCRYDTEYTDLMKFIERLKFPLDGWRVTLGRSITAPNVCPMHDVC